MENLYPTIYCTQETSGTFEGSPFSFPVGFSYIGQDLYDYMRSDPACAMTVLFQGLTARA